MANPKTFTATVGLNYPTGKGEARVEAGDTITDLPAKSVSWLRDGGYILAPGDAAPEVAPEVAPETPPADAAPADTAPADVPTPTEESA